MSQQSLYRLGDHTYVEPLVNSWMAWWLTVAPVPASLNVHSYQVPLLKAYLQSPVFHAKSEREPKLIGGSFVGIPPERANEVRSLLQKTVAEQEKRLRMAEALEEFQSFLMAEAKGQSLEPLYEKIPAPLKGLVELVYDYSNRPSVQILEGLTYRSEYYMPQLQSLRLARLQTDVDRRTFFSTPRLLSEGQIDWPVQFVDERARQLFALDREPRPLGYIRELLGPSVRSDEELLPLLSDAPLPSAPRWMESKVRVRYLGHATVLIEWKGISVLVDPVISVRPSAGGMERLSYADLPEKIDYVLITHAHGDHFYLESLLRLRHRIQHLVVPRSRGVLFGDVSLKLMAQALGFKSVLDPDIFESIPLPDGEIVIAPFLGEHGDLGHAKSAFVVRAGQEKILFAADSTCLDENVYRYVRENLGELTTAFMNSETEGSPLTFTIEALFPKKRDRKLEKNRRCRGSNAAEGLRLLEVIGARRVYSYAMGLEPWLEHVIGPASAPESVRMQDSDHLIAEARTRGLVAERLCGPREFFIEA